MPWIFSAASDIGGRGEQQDRIALLHSVEAGTHLLVVADGAGGHGNGALAAQTVIESVQRDFGQGVAGEPLGFLESICLSAHEAVTDLPVGSGLAPASTCVVLLLRDREAYWAHVGDSRLYHLRGQQVLLQTSDHSLVQLWARSSSTTGRRGPDAPAPNKLYMCLGANCDVLPETNASVVTPDDSFLLCSDGFWSQVSIEEVAESLTGTNFDDLWAQRWVQQAKLRGGDGADNVSLLFARLLPEAQGRGTGKVGSLWAWFKRWLRAGG